MSKFPNFLPPGSKAKGYLKLLTQARRKVITHANANCGRSYICLAAYHSMEGENDRLLFPFFHEWMAAQLSSGTGTAYLASFEQWINRVEPDNPIPIGGHANARRIEWLHYLIRNLEAEIELDSSTPSYIDL